MYDRLRDLLLRLLRVPPEPEPPAGVPESVRVFRAGRNYYRFRLFGWGFKQVLALAGIIFWAVLFIQIEQTIKARQQAGRTPVSPTSVKDFGEYLEKIGAAEKPAPPAVVSNAPTAAATVTTPEAQQDQEKSRGSTKKKRPHARIDGWAGFKQMLADVAMFLPSWSFVLIWTLKVTGFVLYLVQIPFTYAIVRLDYEQRWYVVTDRSLRLRTGVWSVREMTMSFANLQQIAVSQGPLQRLLGLADVRVQSAGGGGGSSHPGHGGAVASLHTGHFHAVDNAEEIRDLITERLRKFRETGLGDPDEKRHIAPVVAPATTDPATLAAAKELLAEAQALRRVRG